MLSPLEKVAPTTVYDYFCYSYIGTGACILSWSGTFITSEPDLSVYLGWSLRINRSQGLFSYFSSPWPSSSSFVHFYFIFITTSFNQDQIVRSKERTQSVQRSNDWQQCFDHINRAWYLLLSQATSLHHNAGHSFVVRNIDVISSIIRSNTRCYQWFLNIRTITFKIP